MPMTKAPTLLAIDTATEACSAALRVADQVFHETVVQPRMQSQLILPMLDRLLDQAGIGLDQVDALAYDAGPGSFTGVRLGVSITQAIAFARSIPVIGVSSLAALAQAAFEHSQCPRVVAAIDARMKEIYWAAYEFDASGQLSEVIGEQVVSPTDLQLPASFQGQQWRGIGSGFDTYHEKIAELTGQSQNWQPEQFPDARQIVTLAWQQALAGDTQPAHQALPKYVRNQVVKEPSS